jgi:hypothetical protein
MRKIIGVLVGGVTLVLMVGSANAANNGTGDPLGLIASAAIQPFFSSGATENTFIEVTSPVGDNSGNNRLEVFYFNAACTRIASVRHPVTRKGAIVWSVDGDLGGLGLALGNVNGLAVISRGVSPDIVGTPIPQPNSIHVKGFWINLAFDFVRIVDPIAVSSTESTDAPKQSYSPLRSAASFGAPPDGAPFFTSTLHLICPNSTVYGVLPTSAGFPAPPATTSTIFGFVYDEFENFLADFSVPCNCSTMIQLDSITSIYATTSTYTELVTYNLVNFTPTPTVSLTGACTPTTGPGAVVCNPPAFTGYRAMAVLGGILDDFGRLANGSAYNYRNSGDDFVGQFPPRFVPGLR